MSSGVHAPESEGLAGPEAVDVAPFHADVGGIPAKPAPAGLSRTELAKARLEEKRQRLAQQRARMAASKASMAGTPSRTASNASRAGSETPSVTSPVAPVSGRTGGTTAVQPSRSATSTSSTPGSGGLTEALRSPRHRSAAIDVPTSPAHHLRRKISEQHQEIHAQLPRPVVRPGAARIAAAIVPHVADVSLGGASGWVGHGVQQETTMGPESRAEGTGSRGADGTVRSVAAQTTASERSALQTSTPRRKVEHSPRYQSTTPFSGLPVTAAQAASASETPAQVDKTTFGKADAPVTSGVAPAYVADAGKEIEESATVSGRPADSGSDPAADKMGFGSLSLASEPQAYPHQTPPVQVQPPKPRVPPLQPSNTTREVPVRGGTASDARESSALRVTSMLVPSPTAEQQLSPKPAVETTAPQPSSVAPAQVLQQPQPEPNSMLPKATVPVSHSDGLTAVLEAPAEQETHLLPLPGTGVAQQLGTGQALFPESQDGADEDSFWLNQDLGPDQAWSAAGMGLNSTQEEAAKGLAAQAALLGRDSPTDTAPASVPAQPIWQVPAPAALPAQQSAPIMPEKLPGAEKDEPPAGDNSVNAQPPLTSGTPLAAASSVPAERPAAVSSIPFAADQGPAPFFSCGTDPFEDAGGDDASFFEQLDSTAGNSVPWLCAAGCACPPMHHNYRDIG